MQLSLNLVTTSGFKMRSFLRLISPKIKVLLLSILLFACSENNRDAANNDEITSLTNMPATYVGAQQCVSCHQEQYTLWQDSHHDLAMQPANEQTVLGDFNNASFDYFGTVSRFYKKGKQFFVKTDGPDGSLTDYPIAYVFGVYPLQQYLIAFPGGRYQALSIAWDSRPREEGGQRWFHLYADEHIEHDDELHWTGINQNWNYMCADCHSTNLEKKYDIVSRQYQTSWSDIDVGCEACHGPGSNHVQWAERYEKTQTGDSHGDAHADKGLEVLLRDRDGAGWNIDKTSGSALRSQPLIKRVELDICGRCHARRESLSSDYQAGEPLLDHFRISLLRQDLYHADGQVDDEVYVYGSFLQSKMHEKGVTCSDCHEPHSLKLRVQGNGMCIQCHAAAKYDSDKHHHHNSKEAGGQCVNCHMPAKNYMVVDARRDHSLRIPRPDLSLSAGTPNACNQCHNDKTAQWALEKVTAWYGEQDRRHFAEAFIAANLNRVDAEEELLSVVDDQRNPAIVRGTALSLLGNGISQRSLPAITQAARDSDPLVRMGAISTLGALPPQLRAEIGAPLLSDPLQVIRTETARHLADLPATALPASSHEVLKSALAEYRSIQQFNADRPESISSLANLALQEGDLKEAERLYKQAIELAPYYVPAYLNLADLYRAQGRETQVYELLTETLRVNEQSGALHHVLGLAQIRQGEKDQGISSLKQAYELAPEVTRYAYVYAVALHSQGHTDEALKILLETHERAANDVDVLSMLANIYHERKEYERALHYAKLLNRMAPGSPQVQALIHDLTNKI